MDVSKRIREQAKRLREQINDLRYKYHVLNDPEVTDAMYEGLMDKLRKLEEQHPELITNNSPTQRIAGEPSEKFDKVIHRAKQWSFNDAFNEDDMRNWEERLLKMLEKALGHRPELEYTCELKIDGLHLVLTYEEGSLSTAATRGNGKVGEDVTVNAKTIQSIPLSISEKSDVVVEGEVWMDKMHFNKINKAREKAGEQTFANPRNMAAGTIRQLDPKKVADRKLQFSAYDISLGPIPASQAEELKRLSSWKFRVEDHWKLCKSIDDVLAFHKEWSNQKKRASKPFWIDGIVVKVNKKEYQDLLGYTGKAPRWAIALKFPAEQGTTTIKDIYVQVGRTGALTPVALMEPVQLAGTTVTHATLHNFDEIKRLGVKVGDTVVVEKAGDVIPKIIRVLEKMRTGDEKKVEEPKSCPICGSRVERREISGKKGETSAALFCTNNNCYGQQLRRIGHFVSKQAMDIDGLGKKIVEQLVDEGLIKDIPDIYTLTKGDLEPLERFAEKSAENLITSIEESKDVTLSRFLFSLGIPQVGEETAIRIADHFGTLTRIRDASGEALQEVDDVGPRVAEEIVSFFADNEKAALVDQLIERGIVIKGPTRQVNRAFKGQTFVLTGTLSTMTRDDAKTDIRKRGGDVSSSVSKNTDYVVVGDNPGSKYQKALDLGVTILDEEEFNRLLMDTG